MSKMLPGQLYEPVEGSYNLPIFANDTALITFTWQHLIDTYVANNGHDVTEKKFRDFCLEQLAMVLDDFWETYDLCKDQILKEVSGI